MEVSAQLIAPRTHTWLLQGWETPPTLQLFDQVCNLVNRAGQVLSVVTADLGPNPLAIVIPNLHLPDWVALPNPPISLDLPATPSALPSLIIDQLTIDMATAVAWNPIPAWHRPLNFDLIHSLVVNHPLFQPAVPLALVSQMQEALYANAPSLIAQTARQLAGLGPGLTPAGDDFLVGILYALHSKQATSSPYCDYCLPLTAHYSLITATAAPHTTTLSANLLQAAGQGEASAAWHDLVTAQGETAVYTAITKILKTGHSSGSDALFGFLLGRPLAN